MDQEVPETTAGLLWVPGLLAMPGIAALSLRGGAGRAGVLGQGKPCSYHGVAERAGSSYSLMHSTKSEKMPTTCHRRMSQNTTVSLVSGGGLGLGGAVLGCGSGERGVSQAEVSRLCGAKRGPGLSPSISETPKIKCLRYSQPMP